ncbi:MAG: thiamine phosphate synthase [Pseudomonadota bacterium]
MAATDSTGRKPPGNCRLYLITPPAFDPVPFADQLAAALDAGDVGCVQLRLKEADDATVRRAVALLLPVTTSRDVALVLNDRPDLAAETGCDGVHVGQQDAGYGQARAAVGAKAIVGVTCHDSPHLAMEAGELGADYVAFGAFFPTTSKEAKSQASLDVLQWWSAIMTVPCVAIGGINPTNCGALVEAGADFLAVISAVWSHPDGPAGGVKAMNAAIAAANQPR